jgi:hypothetical protein
MSPASQEISRLLMSYTGPDEGRVRDAIVKLAGDDLQKVSYYVYEAKQRHREVLLWADEKKEGESELEPLSAMTVNERFACLGLFSAWDAAVARKDAEKASEILRKCEVPEDVIPKIIDAEFKRA